MFFRTLWDYVFLRKPHGIPTSFGQEESFVEQQSKLLKQHTTAFWAEKEYWLLNRLDTATAWLLYFAKTQAAYDWYKKLQSDHQIEKQYLVTVYGKTPRQFRQITTPIAHRQDDPTRMVAVRDSTDQLVSSQIRGKLQEATSVVEYLSYDADCDQSLLQITITKWVRHQIRVHCASVWFPIVNDSLYVPKKHKKLLRGQWQFDEQWVLWLVSVWVKFSVSI